MTETSDNFLLTVYNVLCLIVEIFATIGKFWYLTFCYIYESITAEERSVKEDIVLITGAGHGIGKELALQYSELGATVVCWDINEQLNLDTVNLIKSKGRKAYGYTVDVANHEQVLEASKKVLKDIGDVTILVNNAGILFQREALKLTEKEIRAIFEVNVLSHFWTFEAFLPKMIANNNGHIVALSSMAGIVGSRNLVPYCGTKFAIRGIQDALAEELRLSSNGESKIKFTTIYPFFVNTGFYENLNTRFQKVLSALEPQNVAASIISAQRRGIEQASVPGYMLFSFSLAKLFPNKASRVISDFINVFLESN